MGELPRDDHAGSAEPGMPPRGAVSPEAAPTPLGAICRSLECPDDILEFPLPRQRALRMPLPEEEEELVRDEQVAVSAPCFPKFSRVPSALRKMSNSSGNVLADAELDHCEMFAIPSSDVEVGACIGMGACCQVMRGMWRGRSVAIKTIRICDSAGADDAAAVNSKSKDIVKEIALMCQTFATMSHPNIVGFYGICVDSAQPWLIMEYVGGG